MEDDMWAILGVISALFLGVYDVLKKVSLKGNGVIPVLFFATLSGTLVFIPFILISVFFPDSFHNNILFVPATDLIGHLHIFIKSFIVASSWILAYFAIKHLPLTIVSPVRASGPLWTLLGAIIIFAEKLSPLQWAGLITTIVFYYLFSLAGNKEGINFRKNKWVFFMFLATIIGTISSLYDKYLLLYYHRMTVQAYFSIYLVVVLLPILLVFWYPKRSQTTPFTWKLSIPLIGITLAIADFAYFYALSYEDSLISVLSVLRRSSVIISFVFGALIFREKNLKLKSLILAGIFVGILIIIFGSQ